MIEQSGFESFGGRSWTCFSKRFQRDPVVESSLWPPPLVFERGVSFVKSVFPMAAVLIAAEQSAAVAATVTAMPSTDLAALTVGDVFTITFGAGDDFEPFFGGAIAITYDADVLSFTGGAAIDPPFSFSSVDMQPAGASGSTTVTAMFSAFADQAPGTDFLVLSFEAAAAGVSGIAFDEATVGFMTGFINAGSQQLADIQFETLTAAVTPIPLPAAGWMLIAGVGALLAHRRTS